MPRSNFPNWFKQHTETQNAQMRTVVDAICTRMMDSPWSNRSKEAALALQRAAVQYTEALYRELPDEEHIYRSETMNKKHDPPMNSDEGVGRLNRMMRDVFWVRYGREPSSSKGDLDECNRIAEWQARGCEL